MNNVEQNEVLKITKMLYSLPDIDLCNALESIQHLHVEFNRLKQAKLDNKIVFSGFDTVQ